MDSVPHGTSAPDAPVAATTARLVKGASRTRLEQLLSPFPSPACSRRLWSETWELSHVGPWSLWVWLRLYGAEIAALAVAAGLDESELRRHLEDRQRPGREVLELLADLNCFPHVTPAARPMAAV